MKTQDLEGKNLDYWVAKADGLEVKRVDYGDVWEVSIPDRGRKIIGLDPSQVLAYAPSTRWDQGGPIVERERLEVIHVSADGWEAGEAYSLEASGMAVAFCGGGQRGATFLIAAMRAFVRSKLGVEVSDQD